MKSVFDKNLFSRSTKKVILFFTIFFISRYIIYLNSIQQIDINFSQNYIAALSDNFFEYFLYFHSLPLGNILIAKIHLYFVNILDTKTFYYILNCSYSLFSFLIVYNLCLKIFKKLNIITYLLLFFYILAIIPYETWRLVHHDHINVLLFTYLIHFFYNFIFLKNKNNYHFFIIFFLFALFYSGSLIILTETLFLIFTLNFIKKRKLENKMIIYIIIILLINSFFIIKNNYNIKKLSPTSVMNAVLLQKVHHALGDEKYRNNIEKSDVPIFLKKCLSNIYLNADKSINYFEDITLYKCFYDNKKNQYNYEMLIDLLTSLNVDKKIINQVKKDQIEYDTKPWKFSGGYKEYNNRTGHIFQSETKKIYLNSFINYPYEMLIGNIGSKGFLLTFLQTGSWGGLFPNYYEKHLKLDNLIFNILNIFLATINIFFILFFIFYSFYELVIKRNYKYLNNNLFQLNAVILVFIIGFLFVNASVTCCENPRMTVMIFFLFMTNSLINIISFTSNKNFYFPSIKS